VHTGAAAVADRCNSFAAGSVLLAGGIGAGAWALRRRRGTSGAGAMA